MSSAKKVKRKLEARQDTLSIDFAAKQMGIPRIMAEVLLDLRHPPERRRLPPPGSSLMYDGEGYTPLRKTGFIVKHQVEPGVSSFADYYVITDQGRTLLAKLGPAGLTGRF
jgi:hypothetical protein